MTFGRLAAELERDALHGLGGQLAHAPARARGAGERHHVDVGMRGDRLADHRAGAGHQVEHPGGQPGLVDDSASTNAISGATSLGLSTTVQPAASAGATLATTWCSG